MNLFLAIRRIYPDITFENCRVQDDSNGKGPYIAAWLDPRPQPTAAELETAWADMQLPAAKADRIQSLAAACRAQIEGGFDSAALSTVHHYPAGQQDQANMTASVTASLVPNLPAGWTTAFWCADATGAWSYAEHTASQIQQAGIDGKAAITAALRKNASLAAQVEAATTIEAVAAVVW